MTYSPEADARGLWRTSDVFGDFFDLRYFLFVLGAMPLFILIRASFCLVDQIAGFP